LYEKVISEYITKLEDLLSSGEYDFNEASSIHVPESPGVYIIIDKEGDNIIYIGRTKNLRRRILGNHKSGNIRGSQFRKALMRIYNLKNEQEISNYIRKKCAFKFKIVEDQGERIRLEHFATAIIAPKLNIQLKQ